MGTLFFYRSRLRQLCVTDLLTSGDHFMLQSLNGIEKSHGNIIALYCRNSQMQNKMRLLE